MVIIARYENFEVKRNKHTRTIGSTDKTANYNKSADKLTKSEKLMQGVHDWASYYRSRPDIFAEEYLGISLKPFQKVLLYVMIHFNYTMIFASRGLGKTFLVALYCVVRCILYPGTKITIASKTKEQAMNMVSEKIPELIGMSRTGMIEREITGGIKTSMNHADPNLLFLNGSWIKITASNEQARSRRSNVLILDEFRMVDEKIYRNVLRRFLAVSRQPGFLSKDEYKNNPEYMERNQEIFLSSPYYKFNWSYSRYLVFLKAMLEGKGYFVAGLPYQIAIKENLTSEEQLLDEMREEDMDAVGWQMEMECLFFGESEKAYFKTEELKEIEKIPFPIYEKELQDKIKNKALMDKKNPNEIRVLSCDIALLGGNANDNSIFTLICAKRNSNGTRYKRYVKNIKAYQGVHPEQQALIIRRLFNDFDCDYIVLDMRGNGVSVYSYLCRKLFDNERKIEYLPFYSMNEFDDPKLVHYHTEDEHEKKIYTISPSEESNHDMALDLKDKIINERIELLIAKEDTRDLYNNEAWFQKLSLEEKMDFMMPYIQSQLLQTEMVLLERIEHPKYIKLKELPGKRKDRYSSLAYGNYYISLLERDLNKKKRENKLDVNQLFLYKQANIRKY